MEEEKIEERKVKQVILVRKDIEMPSGKVGAQVAHASLGALLKMFDKQNLLGDRVKYSVEFEADSILDKWLNGIFTKICLSVESEEELMYYYNLIQEDNKDIPLALIEDCGLTCFNGVKTKTCLGIGPFWSDEIDKYTRSLRLLK